jgi:pilus assembly protein CpaE
MAKAKSDEIIRILLVDDIAEIRGSIKKLLSLESDFQVVDAVGTGREGLAMAKELRPDIVIMDINMPDIDGLQITTQIVNDAPGVGVIIMSAQDDPSYMRLAMLAGAKAFLAKPSSPAELYHTVRTVHKRAPVVQATPVHQNGSNATKSSENGQDRAGNIIVVYSPQGGAGCTTIATNLAATLIRENIRVLLVDAHLQFGDVGVFLNLESRSTVVDLVEDVDDLDTDYFENVLTSHNSGLKVLMGPARPELAEKVMANPMAMSNILNKIRSSYDFIIVDTSLHLDEMTLALMDTATRIVLVSTPTLASVRNVRSVLDLFDQLGYSTDKIMLILNRVSLDQNVRKLAIPTDKVALFLKRPVEAMIPTDEYRMLNAVRVGSPVVTLERDHNQSPVKELRGLSDAIMAGLMPEEREEALQQKPPKAKFGFRKRVAQP